MDPICNGGNMNSLHLISGHAQKTLIAIIFTGLLALAANIAVAVAVNAVVPARTPARA